MCCILFVMLIPKVFYCFHWKRVFLSLFQLSFVYRKAIDFCILHLYVCATLFWIILLFGSSPLLWNWSYWGIEGNSMVLRLVVDSSYLTCWSYLIQLSILSSVKLFSNGVWGTTQCLVFLCLTFLSLLCWLFFSIWNSPDSSLYLSTSSWVFFSNLALIFRYMLISDKFISLTHTY